MSCESRTGRGFALAQGLRRLGMNPCAIAAEPPSTMPSLWIVHRSPQVLASLQLLAGRFEGVVSGAPGARSFEAAVPPDVVLLGLDAPANTGFDAAGWELELGFAGSLERAKGDFAPFASLLLFRSCSPWLLLLSAPLCFFSFLLN